MIAIEIKTQAKRDETRARTKILSEILHMSARAVKAKIPKIKHNINSKINILNFMYNLENE